MKDIVNGTLYDTDAETTERLAIHRSGRDSGDFRYWREELYKTQSGSYFVYGTGGPMTKYRTRVGQGEYAGSSEIRPLSDDEAFQWLQQYDIDADIILAEFSDRVEEA